MGVEQYYYTSYLHKKTGKRGFQIKAMSPGITARMQQQLARLISYRIPANLDLSAYTMHPVALRYIFTGPEQAILLCSQSSGPDDHGRPGNFFAHAIVLEPEIFTSVPPIFFWHHPFWRNVDPQERDELMSLPTLADFALEPSLEIDTVWDFLAQGRRKELLAHIVSAIVHSHTTQRRIILLDSVEHVVLWIAAISCLLPPDYRPFLTFATYHHDPSQAPYLITGMTPDAVLHLSPEIVASSFILDAASETILEAGGKPAPPSLYAEFAVTAAESERYETQLLPVFTDYMCRFPHAVRIDEQLDLLACYAQRLQQSRLPASLSTLEQQAIHLALASFEATSTYTQEDQRELRLLEAMLRKALKTQCNEQTEPDGQEHYPSLPDYQRVLALFRVYTLSIELIVRGELLLFTNQLVMGSRKRAVFPHLSLFHQIYGEELVSELLNTSDYVQKILQMISTSSTSAAQSLALFWRSLGHTLQPAAPGREVVVHSLYLVQASLSPTQDTEDEKETQIGGSAQGTTPTFDAEALQQAMFAVLRVHASDWLQLIVTGTPTLPQPHLAFFYRALAEPLDLEAQKQLQEIVTPFFESDATNV